jgi:hypothetical protein
MVRMRLFNFVIALIVPFYAWADLTIFDVRKNLPLSDKEPVYKDFIIDGGSESGLAAGMILTVTRKLPLYDSYQNRSAGDLSLKVAKIKIIHVQKNLAVARLHGEFTRENAPILEDNYIMVGDHIDLGSATTDKKEKAEAEARDSEPAAAAAEPKPQAVAAGSAPPQIVVNTVDLSSAAPKPAPAASPEKVDVPVLQ